MTNTDLASVTETQAPGFQRIRIGNLLITALYDGSVPISADEFHGAPRAEINRLLAEAFMPPDGDPRTAVIAFLVQGIQADGSRPVRGTSGVADAPEACAVIL